MNRTTDNATLARIEEKLDQLARHAHTKREELAMFMGHLLQDVAEKPERLDRARAILLHYIVTGELKTRP